MSFFSVVRLAGVLLALLALLASASLPARAQAQRTTITDLKLAGSGGLYLPATHRALVYTVQPQAGATQLRHYVYGRELGQPRQQEQRLPGRYTLIGTASSRYHALYQLRRHGYDTLLTVVVDTLGQLVSQRREFSSNLLAQAPYMGGSIAPQADGFLLTELGGAHSCRVRFVSPQLQQRWQHLFTSAKGQLLVDDVVADSTYVWVVVTTNARSRRATTKAYCLELATGHVTCRLPLDYNGERRVAGAACIGPGHSLLLAGYSYAGSRPSRARTGRLFVTRLHPDSTRSHDYQVALTPEASLLSAQAPKVLWQKIRPEADGSIRLVGETYTSTSLGGNIAINIVSSIATLGLFRISTTTLHPRGVVALRLSPTGQLSEVRVRPLPEGGSLTMGGYWPARSMAAVARQAGVFRIRDFSSDSQRIVLRTEERVLTMDLQSGQSMTVQAMPDTGHLDVWYVEPKQLLLYHDQRFPQRISLERVAY